MSDTSIDLAADGNDVAQHTWTELAELTDQAGSELGLAASEPRG